MSLPLHRQHERSFADNRFVYPVLSRRSGGISIGVNLNPDKVCNFDCIYCQVNRVTRSSVRFVELPRLLDELSAALHCAASGELYQTEKFRAVPPPLRRLNDIAFSGDGEPTTYKNFDQVIAACAEVKQRICPGLKMVLITNASMFQRPAVQRGLEILERNQGEIWAKLEAGTQEYFQLVERTSIPLARILTNITWAARLWPVVIQAMFMKIHGQPPPDEEFDRFCDRLLEITRAGGQISLVQIYTVARRPAEGYVTSLSDEQVDALVTRVRQRTGLSVQGFYDGINSA